MDALQERWQRVSRGTLHRSPTITDRGVVLGFDTVLVHASADDRLAADAERMLCLLSIVQRRPQSPAALHCLRRALTCWEQGDKALAYIHLALGRLPKVEDVDDAWRLHQAGGLIDLGMAPRTLAEELGLELPTVSLSKYDQDEPRNPAGSGHASGQWTKDPVADGSIAFAPDPQPTASSPAAATAGAGALALRPPAPSLVDALGAEAQDWLAAMADELALPAAFFGALFIPSPNPGTSEQGEVPGHPGLSYALDHDTGTLRLSLDSDPDPDDAIVAQLGPDGIYRDVATNVAFARAVGSNAVLIDLDRAPAIAESATTDTDDPKLCPAPTDDQPGGRKLFDVLYEQYVRSVVNPQRQPPLAPGLAFALPANTKSGWVHYDDCREATGAMIDAKGHYAKLMSTKWGRDVLKVQWSEQAEKQITAAKGRQVEWYFHEAAAASLAREAFDKKEFGTAISAHWLPYPPGVPNPNPRVR